MTNFLKRLWQHRWIRGLAWTAVTLVTLYALVCAWVNWSGARHWHEVQAMLKAEGETLDFRATTTDPIPDAENFCAIPLLKDLGLIMDRDYDKGRPGENRKRLDTLKLQLNDKASARPKIVSASMGTRTDLKAWADWLRKEGSLPVPADSGDAARDVLGALAKHDAVVRELAAGLNRPRAQWTPAWRTRDLPANLFSIALPHYSPMRNSIDMLALRSIAAARTGDAAKAHEAALIIARLNQACLDEPFLIGLLVAAVGTNSLVNATWELGDAQAGTAEDFLRLEAALAGLDYQRAALRAWRSEMAAAVDTLQFFKSSPGEGLAQFQEISTGRMANASTVGNLLVRAIPSGFLDANTAVLADRQFVYLIKPLRDQGWRDVLKSADSFASELKEMRTKIWINPSFIMTSLITPAAKGVLHPAASAQARVNQAIISCALERFRIENGSYPDALADVKLADGKSLPLDIMSGKPMGYRKTANGRYALWSVGFDGKDDEGRRVLDEKHPENTKFHYENYAGDWVWDFPAE